MTEYAPEYYNNFRCIADKCKNNCCIGWEIDIDEDTYTKYKNTKGEFGKRLTQNIKNENATPCFVLDENDRCPFLNDNNLCDIIIHSGENALCEICAQHPRFHNYYECRTESGIGLCCEEAARIILTNNKSFELIVKYDDGLNITEEDFWFDYREKLFETMRNRHKSVKDRMEQLLCFCEIKPVNFDCNNWIEFYLTLERLDKTWTDILLYTKNCLDKTDIWHFIDEYSIAAEQLIIYFLYRYTTKAVYENMTVEWIAFAILSCYMIFIIAAANGAKNIDDICNIARMYSAEIEYSDENIDMIFNKLSNQKKN